MPFLENAWYIAAWSDELAEGKLHRKLLGQDILFYRRRDGSAVALASRCPHRFAPLHYGDLVEGDRIRCRYHGLEFGPDGTCAHNPNDDGPPPPIRVRAYPLMERYQAIWIWMGDPDAAADHPLSDEFSYLDDPDRYAVCKGAMMLECDYRLAIDNLLDAAHANFLHDDSLGSEALTRAKTEVREEGEFIHADRWAPNGAPSPFLGQFLGSFTDPVDQWANSRWERASLLSVDAGATALGVDIAEGIRFRAAHLLTPQTQTSCHYFWAAARNFSLDDETLTQQIAAATDHIFTTEDKWMLEGQQAMLGDTDFWAARPKLLAGDHAAVAVRRRIDRLIEAEQAGAAAP
jgi:vanillate O-demethylase monooxygenase subunit